MGHNRYWAVDNIYAKQNGGGYDFVMEKKGEDQNFKDFSWPSEQVCQPTTLVSVESLICRTRAVEPTTPYTPDRANTPSRPSPL